MITLTTTEMETVSAGAATASLSIGNLFGSGPTSATATASGLSAVAATVGGLSPSNTAIVSGTITTSSS